MFKATGGARVLALAASKKNEPLPRNPSVVGGVRPDSVRRVPDVHWVGYLSESTSPGAETLLAHRGHWFRDGLWWLADQATRPLAMASRCNGRTEGGGEVKKAELWLSHAALRDGGMRLHFPAMPPWRT